MGYKKKGWILLTLIKRIYNFTRFPLLVVGVLVLWSILGVIVWGYVGRYYFEHFLMISVLAIPYLLLHFILNEYDLFYPKTIGTLEKWTGTYSYYDIFHQLELIYEEDMGIFDKMVNLKSAIWKYCGYKKGNLQNLMIILNSLKDVKEKDKNTTILATIITGAMLLALRSGMLLNNIFTIEALSESEIVFYNLLTIVLLGLVFILALIKIHNGEYKSITLLSNLTKEMYEEKK